MTQQLQDEFETSMENIEAWMKAIHERLRVNDNTQGPRAALEARLRETEKICDSESEGRLKMDMVLMKADALLHDSEEDEKHEIMSKLKHIKALFEDTTTYMTHCHSRIEWVWLHWSEYLRARDEFAVWAHNMRLTLEPEVELQLGLKEKQWQLSHGKVLMKDVRNQSGLMDRLLEEASALFNRIGDPSVDENVQKQMKAEYEEIRAKAEERVNLLGDIAKDHEQYQENIEQFRQWLNSVIEKLKNCVRRTTESTADRLKMHQGIAEDVRHGERLLEDLKVKSATVIRNTSPLGAEKITEELDELRKATEKLKLMNEEEEEELQRAHQSESTYQAQAKQLEAAIREFRKGIQRLENNLDSGEQARSAEELEALWRKCTAISSALAEEKSKAEALKTRLKELFRFSQDVEPLSASVLSAIQQYQSAKGTVFKLRTTAESDLKRHFKKPLREVQCWKAAAQRLLESTSSLSDPPLIQNFLPQIEASLEDSCRLKEELPVLQQKKDLLESLLNVEEVQAVLEEAARAAQEGLIDESADFDFTLESLQKRLAALRQDVTAASEKQPDLAGKEKQLQSLQKVENERLKLGLQIEEFETSAQSHPAHRHKISQLNSDHLNLKRLLQAKLKMCKQGIGEYQLFGKRLAGLQQWLTSTSGKLKDMTETWEEETRLREVESLLSDLHNREIQLHQLEAGAQNIAGSSSDAGAAHILGRLQRLRSSWDSVKEQLEALAGLPQADALGSPSKNSMDSRNPGERQKVQRILVVENNEDDYQRRRKDFEEWLQGENASLTSILATGASSTSSNPKTRLGTLQKLHSRIADGQALFQALLEPQPVQGTTEDLQLEDLRYRWILYKSKLKEESNVSSLQAMEDTTDFEKPVFPKEPRMEYPKSWTINEVERENVQKRTFTRWINLHLEKCKPPLQVQDLFIDIQDGKILMALLEVLSGQSLLHEYKSSSHRIFRLNNIAKALTFLENCNVKLVSIDAAEIADGNSSLILGLIWNIILFFQIKEFTGNLNKMVSSSSLSSLLSCPDSDTSQPSTPSTEKSVSMSIRDQRKAIKALLSWVQERTRKYGVAVQDFASSWQSGLAFLAVIKAIDSSLVNMKQAFERSPRENLEDAFNLAYDNLSIPKLLEPEDLIVESPDEQSIITYVAQFLEHFPELEGDDISEAKENSPVETTYVHIKDGPQEQEGTVFIVNENGDCAFTICHESTQPPAQKIHLCTEMNVRDRPQPANAQTKSNGNLTLSLKRPAQTPVEEEESLPAEPHRSSSWHASGTVSFKSDDSWHDLGNKRPHYEQISENHTQEIRRDDVLTVSPNGKKTVDENNSELLSLEVPTNCNSEALHSSDALKQSRKTQDSPLDKPGVLDSESFCGAVDKPDGAVGQRHGHLSEETSPITTPLIEENNLNVLMTPRKEEETIKYILHLQEEEVLKKPSVGYEHPPQMSNLQLVKVNAGLANDSREKGQPDLFRSTRSEIVAKSSQSHEPPPSGHNGEGPASPGSTKVSVIPHDLFYYPHYTVPIADVLDAFVNPGPYDSKNDEVSNQLNGVQEQEKSHGEGQQTLRKTNNTVLPAQGDKSISRNIASDVCLGAEVQEVGREHANSSFSDTDTDQKGKTDSVSPVAQNVFSSEEADSVVRKKFTDSELNYSVLTKTDSTSNGTARISENVEPVENQFEDTSAVVLDREISAKMMSQKQNGDDIEQKGFPTWENRSIHLPEKAESNSFANVCFLRPTSSDTSINYQHYNSAASDMDLSSEIGQKDKSVLQETSVAHRKKVKWEDEPEIKISAEPEALSLSEHFPDILYFLLLLWLLIYLLLILPELSIGKLRFLQQ
uniref:Calmin n=1 Tax=Geotrypetes seraphini TaxID=260995 RepID=A0A6P8RP07_GEOSA|nr:uncharacterized protein LOC117363385 isoform X2 [Geotrypetes seraphini]